MPRLPDTIQGEGMIQPPDFEQIAAELFHEKLGDDPTSEEEVTTAAIVEALRQVWNAGKEAGDRTTVFFQHLKDENNAAHLALDRYDAPKTTQAIRRGGIGKQEITIGLADRIHAMQRQVWNARGAANLQELLQMLEDRDAGIQKAHARLDRAGVPLADGCACDDPTCQTKLEHRIKLLIAERDAVWNARGAADAKLVKSACYVDGGLTALEVKGLLNDIQREDR